MIILHVLGAGGAVPTATHGPAAYWLSVDGQGLLLDPGPGALVRLVRQPGAPDDVDQVSRVFLSHLHLDHTADLAPLLFAAHSVLARETSPLQLVGPRGTAAFLDRLRDVYGNWLEPRCRQLQVHEVAPGESVPLPGGGRAEAFLTSHEEHHFAADCLGWSFQDADGRRLFYSGDTGPSPALERAARGCDLLLIECSTPDDLAVTTHLSPAGVAAVARNSRPGRVVLTHMYPLVATKRPDRAVAEATGLPCHAAQDGDVFTIPAEMELPT